MCACLLDKACRRFSISSMSKGGDDFNDKEAISEVLCANSFDVDDISLCNISELLSVISLGNLVVISSAILFGIGDVSLIISLEKLSLVLFDADRVWWKVVGFKSKELFERNVELTGHLLLIFSSQIFEVWCWFSEGKQFWKQIFIYIESFMIYHKN